MRISIERARKFSVAWPWVRFVLSNTDIMMALTHAPLRLQHVSHDTFQGKRYGIFVKMRVVVDAKPDPVDEVQIITDVAMPLGLGRTYTVGHYRYEAISPSTTMVDLKLELNTAGPFMAIYFMMLKTRIDNYINRVMCDNERAGALLQENDPAVRELLDNEQCARVSEFRGRWGRTTSVTLPTEAGVSSPEIKTPQVWLSEITELTKLYESCEVKVNLIEEELARMQAARDAVATLLVARRILEVIVTQICEEKLKRPRGTEPLATVLHKIAQDRAVPEYIVTSMENLNRLSTYGAHPKEFSPRQVREALIALCSIMEWYVQFTKNRKGSGG